MSERIGIVGGGQLGMMLTEAAKNMNLQTVVVDKAGCPASIAGATVIDGSITDTHSILKLADVADIVTVEIEHINTEALEALERQGIPVHPSPETLAMIKNKYEQKLFLKRAGIATADFLPIEAEDDFTNAQEEFGYPYVLKTRYGAYDGRGNERVMSADDLQRAREGLGDVALYAERFVPFSKELAVMVARSTTGEIKTFPVVETVHEKDILRYTFAPAAIDENSREDAEALAQSVVQHLKGAGVFGIEMFLTPEGDVLVNEIAPRVHNSGHYTIEACETSQFTQHLLAITGQPLGETSLTTKAAVMVNILGDNTDKATSLSGSKNAEALGKVFVHDYHKKPKSPPDPLRKNGHITALGESVSEARQLADTARGMMYYG
jgi:phosphoribosylaminoimidazole carboxylase PurK protein